MEGINQGFVRHIHQEIGQKHLGVTVNQVVVMKKISDRQQMTVSEVAEDLGISLSAITALVDRLCKSDFLTRRRDVNDRRLVWLELTAAGQEVVDICVACRNEVLGKYLSKLEEEDLDKLIDINEKILKLFKDEEQGR
ncbi:MAG: MarR family transcriptional regulator [Clostridiales bacterium]|nr:MarR family transcriptional regulator [Clostridiales bacterium]MCF8023364.1 MarR family transcriptional regulator [Clostridiales bacterium]